MTSIYYERYPFQDNCLSFCPKKLPHPMWIALCAKDYYKP